METRKELKFLIWTVIIFLTAFFLPVDSNALMTAIHSALNLSKWYAREHIVLCLLPAFFIAGVIAVFVSQGAVLKYFGAKAKKWLSYTVASVSGGILAVCSCTILPLFTSIYKRGAGLGPAIAFLYSGPAISILSIILTARILGLEMGLARVIGAVTFAVIIGLVMSFIFRKEERDKKIEQMNIVPPPEKRPLWQTAVFFLHLGGNTRVCQLERTCGGRPWNLGRDIQRQMVDNISSRNRSLRHSCQDFASQSPVDYPRRHRGSRVGLPGRCLHPRREISSACADAHRGRRACRRAAM